MTKDEAQKAMDEGHMVTHTYFTDDEYMTKSAEGGYLFEDGIHCEESEFWRYREESEWQDNWQIFNK